MGKYLTGEGLVKISCDWGGGCSRELTYHHDAPNPPGWVYDDSSRKVYCSQHVGTYVDLINTTPEIVEVAQGAASALSPDVPVVLNNHGGSQSFLPYRCDLFDPQAMLDMAAVLHSGAIKHGGNNWHNISRNEHLNHLLVHVFAELLGNTEDDHASHIMCRAMFAAATTNTFGPNGYHK